MLRGRARRRRGNRRGISAVYVGIGARFGVGIVISELVGLIATRRMRIQGVGLSSEDSAYPTAWLLNALALRSLYTRICLV